MLCKKVTIVMMLILAFAGVPIVRAAGIPHMINYQGELTDPNAEPIHDPNLSMTFTFYDAPVDGNTLFSESQNVDVNDGFFGLLIGSASEPNGIPESVFAGEHLYLGIQVGTDLEMTPRQRVTSTAFAYRAEKAGDAELLGGQEASEFASSVHDHDDRYYSESEIDSLFYTASQIDSLFYSKSEIDTMFYTKSEIDSLFYTKTELDPKLLTSSEKAELTGGGETTLHTHPGWELEPWPTLLIYSDSSTVTGGSSSWILVKQWEFQKVPGHSVFRVESNLREFSATTASIRINAVGQDIYHTTSGGSYITYQDVFDYSMVEGSPQIPVSLYLKYSCSGMCSGPYAENNKFKIYVQQNP